MILKQSMKEKAENNLKNYRNVLKLLQRSDIENKDLRIEQCKRCIRKQEQIISNIEKWESD